MTKYILEGGSNTTSGDVGERLAIEVGKTLPRPIILSCFFSSEETDWDEKFANWGGWFRRYFGQEVQHERASREAFLGQVSTADVVFFHGGQTRLLLDVMGNYPAIEQALEGKVVIGSSAGANYLSRVGYSPRADEFMEGSGMTPFNVIVHYDAEEFNGTHYTPEDWLNVRHRFEEFLGPNEIVTPLREGEFVVIER